MRIAIDATPLIGPGTGVATFTGGALAALAARPDLDVVAYGLTLRGHGALAAAVPAGVVTAGRPMPAAALLRLWSRAPWPAIQSWTGPVDVVHGTNFVVPPARRAARVVTVYDLTAVRFPELCAPASLRYPDLVRRAVREGAWVHTLAHAIAEEIVDLLGVPAERVRVVPSGLTVEAPGDAAAGRARAGATSYVLALGTVEPRKGLPALVAAFDRIADAAPDLHLVIAGPDGWGSEALAAAIAASGARSRIRRLGWLDAGARADVLAGATVLAAPSVYEGFGYPPLEAMAAGVPVVATAVGALPEVVGDAAVLVASGAVDALAEAILALARDEHRRDDLVRRGRQRAALLRWDACAKGLVELYRAAVAGEG